MIKMAWNTFCCVAYEWSGERSMRQRTNTTFWRGWMKWWEKAATQGGMGWITKGGKCTNSLKRLYPCRNKREVIVLCCSFSAKISFICGCITKTNTHTERCTGSKSLRRTHTKANILIKFTREEGKNNERLLLLFFGCRHRRRCLCLCCCCFYFLFFFASDVGLCKSLLYVCLWRENEQAVEFFVVLNKKQQKSLKKNPNIFAQFFSFVHFSSTRMFFALFSLVLISLRLLFCPFCLHS